MNEIIGRLLGLILNVISPEFRKMVIDLVAQLEVNAKKTTNPWDDMLVAILKTILNIK